MIMIIFLDGFLLCGIVVQRGCYCKTRRLVVMRFGLCAKLEDLSGMSFYLNI